MLCFRDLCGLHDEVLTSFYRRILRALNVVPVPLSSAGAFEQTYRTSGGTARSNCAMVDYLSAVMDPTAKAPTYLL